MKNKKKTYATVIATNRKIVREAPRSGGVAEPTLEKASNSLGEKSRIVTTSGEIFADGSVIELVTSASENRLNLLFWNQHQKRIASTIEYLGRAYQAPDLDQTLLRAICFPMVATQYGTGRKLFTEISKLFERYIGSPKSDASLLTAWSCSTWFPDCVASPPTLLVSGPDMGHAMTLFRLLSCLCRRSLVLADITRSGLLAVMRLQPTLLMNRTGEFPKIWDLCGTSNYRGVYVLNNLGGVHTLAGSKAFFAGMGNTWSDEAVHLALPAAPPDLLTLDEQRQAEIANRFQPQLLMYRLRNLRRVRESHSAVCQLKFPNTEVARNLAACIQGEPDIAQAIAPILQRQDEDVHARRDCDVDVAIVEVIWVPLHQTREITITRVAELTNALLRCRGETLEYSAVEIGWKLRNLGLYRHRNGSGMVLRFSNENSLSIHRLAQRFGLSGSGVPGCPNCVQPEVIGRQ
jgi:hypothetical protein